MKIQNGVVKIEPVGTIFPPDNDNITLKEINGTCISLPISLVIRAYEIAKRDCERLGGNWDEYCRHLLRLEN